MDAGEGMDAGNAAEPSSPPARVRDLMTDGPAVHSPPVKTAQPPKRMTPSKQPYKKPCRKNEEEDSDSESQLDSGDERRAPLALTPASPMGKAVTAIAAGALPASRPASVELTARVPPHREGVEVGFRCLQALAAGRSAGAGDAMASDALMPSGDGAGDAMTDDAFTGAPLATIADVAAAQPPVEAPQEACFVKEGPPKHGYSVKLFPSTSILGLAGGDGERLAFKISGGNVSSCSIVRASTGEFHITCLSNTSIGIIRTAGGLLERLDPGATTLLSDLNVVILDPWNAPDYASAELAWGAVRNSNSTSHFVLSGVIPDVVRYAYRFVVESTRASQTVEGVEADALDGNAGSGSSDESSDEESDERQRAAIQTALEAANRLLANGPGSWGFGDVRSIVDELTRAGVHGMGKDTLALKLAKAKAKAEGKRPPKSRSVKGLNADEWLPALIAALEEEEANFEERRLAALLKKADAAAKAAAVDDAWAFPGNLATHA